MKLLPPSHTNTQKAMIGFSRELILKKLAWTGQKKKKKKNGISWNNIQLVFHCIRSSNNLKISGSCYSFIVFLLVRHISAHKDKYFVY